ncbi:MAG TPA: methyltransferase domain-containing protein [Pseudomonadales bacterium]
MKKAKANKNAAAISNANYRIDILECPVCHAGPLKQGHQMLECTQCGESYAEKDGIPVLLASNSAFTKLDDMDYDDHHNIDGDRREKVADDWQDVFDERGVTYGDVLEIGCGTGQLTWGLAKQLPFKSVHACDISFRFLNELRTDLSGMPGGADVNYYLCDANQLPFRDESLDLIVGHSVLHHFIHYEKVIENVRRMLKPGGKAMFYEPVIQGKIWVAFFGELIIRTERNTKVGIMDDDDIEKIKRMNRHILKSKWLEGNEEALAKMEDKYIFDLDALAEKSRDWGYSHFEFANNGKPHWGYKWHVQQHLLMAGIKPEKIQQFTYMFNAFGHSLSDLVPKSLVTPMGYLIFSR